MENIAISEEQAVPRGAVAERTVAQKRKVERVGRVGVGMSVACAVHCMLLPFLLVGAPAMGLGYLAGHGAELVLIGVMLATAVACSCWGFRVHGKKRLFIAFGGAIAFVLIGEMFAEDVLKRVLVLLGGVSLVLSHFLNAYLCRRCPTAEDTCCGPRARDCAFEDSGR